MTEMLHGVRVLDLSRVLAAPLCSMTLGDLGADVIKVERPIIGDETRTWGPPFDERGESAYYLSINRNKLSIALDLDAPDDRLVLQRLVAGADVVLDNYKRGTLERKELAPSRFLSQHPRLIWCSVTGFGPESDRLGYDFVVQAESGWMSITGESNGEPMKSGIALADQIAGKDAAITILAALVSRERSADPIALSKRRLFISLAQSATASLINVAQNALVSGAEAKRWGNAHPNLVPYELFGAANRSLVIAVGNDGQWMGCCSALSLDALASDEQLRTNSGRLAARERVVGEIANRVRERSAEECLDVLAKHGVPCGLVRTVREALSDGANSALTGIVPAVPGSVRLPPPRLDEHGERIRSLGWEAFRAST